MASQRGGEGGLPPPSSELKCKCGPEKRKGEGKKEERLKLKRLMGKRTRKGRRAQAGFDSNSPTFSLPTKI